MGGSRFVLFLVIVAMAGFAFLLVRWTNNELTNLRAGASSTASLEAESGVLSANAASTSDSSASDGKYVLFSSSGGLLSSLPLKDTNYTIPTGALYVAKTGTDNSSCGTLASPCRTITYTVNKAPASGTVVIRSGEYHEYVQVSKKLTIQAYPHEAVWLTGLEDITGFVQDGTIWRKDNYTFLFKSSTGGPIALSFNATNYINPQYPMSIWPDMAFLNGNPLKQVGTKAEVVTGTFFVDYPNQKLYIGDNPSGKTVSAASLDMAMQIHGTAGGTAIKGLGFKAYANVVTGGKGNMVHMHPTDLLLENNTFAFSASNPLGLNQSHNSIIRGNTMIYNGIQGGGSYQANNIVWEKNYMAYNNYEHFAEGNEAGGSKMVALHGGIVRDNIFENNYGKGYWCDTDCRDVIIVRNVTRNNTSHGIMYELATRGIIASNLVVGNGQDGIKLGAGAAESKVFNNTLVRNKINLAIVTDDRFCTTANIGQYGCSTAGMAAGVTNITSNAIVINNIFSNNDGTNADYEKGSNFVFVRNFDDPAEIKPADFMVKELDYNYYFRTSTQIPVNLITWWNGKRTPQTWYNFKTIQEIRTAKSHEVHGKELSGATNPLFTDEQSGDFTLSASSPAKGAGQPLTDTTVINAINSGLSTPIVTQGSTINMGAINWPTSL